MKQILAMTLLVACAGPVENTTEAELAVRGYHVVKLHGENGAGNGIDNIGRVNGAAAGHATAWFFGAPITLTTANSTSAWPVKNVRGMVSGIIEVPGTDPNNEAWSCAAFIDKTPGYICRGFVWDKGQLRILPTLGGTHGFATGTNHHAQTVGWAETTTRDPSCNQVDQFLGFNGVVWSGNDIRVLPPVAGDSASAATAINDRGQVAGISGACGDSVGSTSARHMVIWEPDGTITNLGDLGGVAWNTAMSINERGDVVGFANAPGTEPPTRFNYRPFLWTKDSGVQDLGTLAGDLRGQALGINVRGQVVGMSRGTGFRGVIWQGGTVTDLNTLIVSGSHDAITSANDINDLGMITGTSVDASGAQSAFLALPVF